MDRNTAILIVIALLAIFLYGQIDYRVEPYSGMDLKYYQKMADASPSIASDVPRPFAYRILGPWLAGLAGDGNATGFHLVTILSSLVLVILLYRLFTGFSVSAGASAIAVTLFILNKHLFGTGSWNFFQVKDTLSLALAAGAFLAMYGGRHILFGLLLAAGSLSGELTLIMIPVLVTYLVERKRPAGEILRATAFCLPAIVIFVCLRLFVPVPGGMGLFEAALHYGAKLRYPMVWFGLLVNPFIPVTLVPLVCLGDTVRFVRENKHIVLYFILVLASASFGSNNERLMALSAPAFYALIAFLLDSRAGRSGLVRLVLIAAAFLSSLHHTIARFPLPARSITVILSLGSLAAVTLVFAFYAARWRGAGRNAAG